MKKVEATVLIAASQESVFDLLIYSRRHKEFVYGYVEQYQGPEILSGGVWFHWKIKLYGRVCKAHSFVSAFDRPSQYQEQINIPGIAKVVLTKTLKQENEKTRLTWLWEYKPAFWILGAVIDKLACGEKTIGEGLEYSLREIKRIMERGAI